MCANTEDGEKCTHNLPFLTERFCGKFRVPPTDCFNSMLAAFGGRLEEAVKGKWDGKHHYRLMGINKQSTPLAIEDTFRDMADSLTTHSHKNPKQAPAGELRSAHI